MSKVPANKVRQAVMGDAFVERAMNNTTEFTQPLQDFINQHACTAEEIREAILHCAVYAGVPAAGEAFRAAQEVIEPDA